MSSAVHQPLGTFNLKDFNSTSSSKDFSSTVQVDDVDASNGGKYDVNSLLADAPMDSIRQKINVERDEQIVEGPLSSNDEAMLNNDVVSEKVDLDLVGGQVQVTVCVRCERTVPLYSMDSVYKQSSVIVTRRVQIDMDCTETRRQLYAALQRRQYDNSGSDGSKLRLSAKETFQLYKGFMGLVEANEAARVNSFKPQPGSILADDIDIFKRSSTQSWVNGSSSSNRTADHMTSADLRIDSDSSPSVLNRTPFSRDAVGHRPTLLSERLENRLKSTADSDRMTSYSSRLTSRPESNTPYMSHDIGDSSSNFDSRTDVTSSYLSSVRPYQRYDESSTAYRSPFAEDAGSSSYSSRFSSVTRDAGEYTTDYPSTRMSVYDKYRSRSPFAAEEGMALSSSSAYLSSKSMTSRNAVPDINSNTEVASRPSSRYERIMSSRSRSPYRNDEKTTFITRDISLDDNSEAARPDETYYTSSDTRSSRFSSLRSKSPFSPASEENTLRSYTATNGSSNWMTSRDTAVDSDADGFPRSMLSTRYNGFHQSLQSPPEDQNGGTTPSFESRSRFSSRVSSVDTDRSATSDYLSSRLSRLRAADSSAAEHNEPVFSSRQISSPRDENGEHVFSTTTTSSWRRTENSNSPNESMHRNDVTSVTRNDVSVGSSEQSERPNQFSSTYTAEDQPQNSVESDTVSQNVDYASSYLRMRSGWKSENDGRLNGDVVSINHDALNGTDKTLNSNITSNISSSPMTSLQEPDDDTWKPVADAISAAMTSLNTNRDEYSRLTDSDAVVMSPVASSIAMTPEVSVGQTHIQHQSHDSAAATEISYSSSTTDDATSVEAPPTTTTRPRRSSTSSTSSITSSTSGMGSLSSLMRPTAASSARRGSATPSASTGTGSSASSRPTPSYASPTSSSSSKLSAATGAAPKPAPISRTKSSPALRDATVVIKTATHRAVNPTSGTTSSRSSSATSTGRTSSTSVGRTTPGTSSTERRGSASSITTPSSTSVGRTTPGTSSTERRGSASSITTPSSTTPTRSSVSSTAGSELRRSRNASGGGSFSEKRGTASSATLTSGAPSRPVTVNRPAPTPSGRRTPTATAPGSTSQLVNRTTGTGTHSATGPPTTPSSRPPIAPSSTTSSRPATAARPYRSRNTSTS